MELLCFVDELSRQTERRILYCTDEQHREIPLSERTREACIKKNLSEADWRRLVYVKDQNGKEILASKDGKLVDALLDSIPKQKFPVTVYLDIGAHFGLQSTQSILFDYSERQHREQRLSKQLIQEKGHINLDDPGWSNQYRSLRLTIHDKDSRTVNIRTDNQIDDR